MQFLKLNRGKLHDDKNKSNVISIGDHIYPLDKALLLDWTKVVQDKTYVSSG